MPWITIRRAWEEDLGGGRQHTTLKERDVALMAHLEKAALATDTAHQWSLLRDLASNEPGSRYTLGVLFEALLCASSIRDSHGLRLALQRAVMLLFGEHFARHVMEELEEKRLPGASTLAYTKIKRRSPHSP